MECPTDINLLTCSAEELGNWLLQHRFQKESSPAVEFLQQTVSSLKKKNSNSKVSAGNSTDIGTSMLQNSDTLEVSLTTPRVKANWVCCESGMRFTDKKGESLVVRKAKHIVVFPKPEDCNKNKNVTDMVLLVPHDDDNVTYKTKKQTQICFQLPSTAPDWEEDMENLDHSDQWIAVLCRSCSFDVASVARVINPAMEDSTTAFWRYQFQSHQEESTSTTTGGMPFVKCYYGVNDGALYPMLEGLLFFKPPLFIPRSEMESIGCGRDNGSRYVDLQVTRAGKQLDFSNIHRSEINELREYIHQKLIPAMQKDVSNTGSPVKRMDVDVQVLEEEEEDVLNRSRKRRKASLEAEAVNRQSVGANSDDDDDDDEDGDNDYVAGTNDVDDGDDDDDDDEESEEEEDFEEQETETESEDED